MAKTSRTRATPDTRRQRLGEIYARALLGAAEKAGNTEQVLTEFESLVRDVLDKLPRLDAVLSSPRVGRAEKERILDGAFRGEMSTLLLNFLKVVSNHDRLDCLRVMLQAARELYNELRGRVAAEVHTADPLEGELLETLAGRLQQALGRPVALQTETDPDLIGGIVIRVGDTVYDGSVANRLRQLRQETLDRAIREIRSGPDRFTRST